MRSRLLPAVVLCTAAALTLGACSSSGGKKPETTSPSSSGGSGTAVSLKSLTGTSTTVTIAPAFVAQAAALKIVPSASGTAKVSKSGSTESFSFPITGGTLSVNGKSSISGSIQHDGSGIAINAAGTNVVIDKLVVNPGANGTISGEVKVGGAVIEKNLALFDLDPSTLADPAVSGKTVTLAGYTVYVDTGAAQALNLFIKGSTKLPTTKNAIKVGTATIIATGS